MDADTFLESWSNPNNPAAYSGQNIVAKHIPLCQSMRARTRKRTHSQLHVTCMQTRAS